MKQLRKIVRYLNEVATPAEIIARLHKELDSYNIKYDVIMGGNSNGLHTTLKVTEDGENAFVWNGISGKLHTMSNKHETIAHEYEDIAEKINDKLPAGYQINYSMRFKLRDLYGAGEDCGSFNTVEDAYDHFFKSYRQESHFKSEDSFNYWRGRPQVLMYCLNIRTGKYHERSGFQLTERGSYYEDKKDISVITDIEIFE